MRHSLIAACCGLAVLSLLSACGKPDPLAAYTPKKFSGLDMIKWAGEAPQTDCMTLKGRNKALYYLMTDKMKSGGTLDQQMKLKGVAARVSQLQTKQINARCLTPEERLQNEKLKQQFPGLSEYL